MLRQVPTNPMTAPWLSRSGYLEVGENQPCSPPGPAERFLSIDDRRTGPKHVLVVGRVEFGVLAQGRDVGIDLADGLVQGEIPKSLECRVHEEKAVVAILEKNEVVEPVDQGAQQEFFPDQNVFGGFLRGDIPVHAEPGEYLPFAIAHGNDAEVAQMPMEPSLPDENKLTRPLPFFRDVSQDRGAECLCFMRAMKQRR